MNYSNQNRRLQDFPELQIGYPERNDVEDPQVYEMERYHFDLERMELVRVSASNITSEIRGQGALRQS